MNQVFLNAPEDIAWLKEVHIPEFEGRFHSAILYGNEDSPERVEVYASSEPLVSDSPVGLFIADEDGDLICQ